LSNIAITNSIILVDDERDVVELFREALIASGFKVSAFTDPLAALDHVQKNPDKFNLLVSDFSMKKLNGCDLAIRIKEMNDKIKVILISAYENIEGNTLNFELLQKPIPLQLLIEKVNSYVK
jgi:two-component system cell cycle sensor histidine kinase/response regulator CckA